MEQRVVHLAFRDLESEMAMKACPPERTSGRCKKSAGSRNERGQSVLLFAILMPIMSLFLLGILDYMVTSARVMETVAAADLAAHAGAQEITVLPNGTIIELQQGMELRRPTSIHSGRVPHTSPRFPVDDIRNVLRVMSQLKFNRRGTCCPPAG